MQSQTTSTALKVDIPTEKLYDLCMIEQLCRGNLERVKKMVKVFIEQIPLSVEEIKLAFNKRDFVKIKNVAHRIKPTLSYYAIVKIEKDIQLIERLAKDELANPELELKIKKLDNVINEIVVQMKKDLLH
jgi:HPt (histidine-containing phosphotransfer) domain-containing protein